MEGGKEEGGILLILIGGVLLHWKRRLVLVMHLSLEFVLVVMCCPGLSLLSLLLYFCIPPPLCALFHRHADPVAMNLLGLQDGDPISSPSPSLISTSIPPPVHLIQSAHHLLHQTER